MPSRTIIGDVNVHHGCGVILMVDVFLMINVPVNVPVNTKNMSAPFAQERFQI